jgi:translocation and assembly module TamB
MSIGRDGEQKIRAREAPSCRTTSAVPSILSKNYTLVARHSASTFLSTLPIQLSGMRRFLRFSLGFIALLLVGLAALPWWLGPALPALGRSHGVTFSRYERLGYTRFALDGLVVHASGTTVTAARVEADSPLIWLGRRILGQPGPVNISQWHVEVAATPSAPHPKPGGWIPLRRLLKNIFISIRPWVPDAQIGSGEARWPGGAIKIASARLQNATLKLDEVSYGTALVASGEFSCFPQGEDTLTINAFLASQPVRLTLESRADDLTGQLSFLDQPAALSAHFNPSGWTPTTAHLRSDNWTVPGSRLPRGEAYATVRGAAQIDWREDQLNVDFTATGTPAANHSAPPLSAQLHARSDGTALRVETLHLALPGLQADLTQPVVIDRSGKLLSGDSHFTLAADLAAWPQLATLGTVTGEATVSPGEAQFPRVDFHFVAKSLAFREWRASALSAAGRLTWPQLQLNSVSLESAAGDRLTGHGGWDFSTATLRETEISGSVARASLALWLPPSVDFSKLALKIHVSGPLATLTHTGEAQISALSIPSLKPLALSVQWQGRGKIIEKLIADATSGTTRVKAAGTIDAEKLTLTELTLTAPALSILQLKQPTTLRWTPAIQLSGFSLANADSSLIAEFALGAAGRFNLAVKNFSSATHADLLALPGPAWSVATLNAQGSWDHGPLTFTTQTEASVALNATQSANFTLAAQGDATGVQLTALQIIENTETAVQASGHLPITLTPVGPAHLTVLPDAALTLTASTEPTAHFWTQLQALTGVAIVAPQFNAQLEGTWSKPRGTAVLRATRLAVDSARLTDSLPDLENVELKLSGDSSGFVIDRFSALLDGQSVRASGRLPMGAGAWEKLQKTPLAQLTQAAELHLEIPDADMAVLSRQLPDYLAPQGRLNLDLTLKPGGIFDGTLELRNAASRPIGVLGVLQDITADLHVAGRTLELRNVSARAGGEPVTLTGKIELPPKGEPRLDFALKGTNLPLVRQLGLLLRGDLDLRLTTPASGQTQLGGTVRLHDSLFLADVRDLLPSGERGPSARAPYFSVEAAPFNRWRLDVAIDGDRFLRLRTALFTGIASAHFRLNGTLGNPLATGEAVVNEGTVLLPFASFAVQQSSLRLTADNPYDLQLWLTGTTRRYGYDLRLELSGTLSAPVLAFSANPALESKQVLLLVMAGQLPSNSNIITDRQRVTRLGAYLGQSLLGSLGGDTTAGDRLSITTGERISQQGRETFAMEYRLDDRWSLVGEYDEFDDYNAGVKWRIFANERHAFNEKP